MTDVDRLERDLAEACFTIAADWDASLHGKRDGGESDAVAGTPEPPMPVDAATMDIRAECCARLAGWSLLIAEERELRPSLDGNDAVGMARFVSTHAQWLAGHVAGRDAAREIADSARQIRWLARPQRRDFIVIGECPVTVASPEGESVPCGGLVRAYTEKTVIRCPRCDTEDTLDWWESKIVPSLVEVPLLTAAQLLVFLHQQTGTTYTETAIRQWATRGYILRHGRDWGTNRTLYDRVAVLAFVTDGTKESDRKAA